MLPNGSGLKALYICLMFYLDIRGVVCLSLTGNRFADVELVVLAPENS